MGCGECRIGKSYWKVSYYTSLNSMQLRCFSLLERYIVPAMTMESLKIRLGNIIERDWKNMGEALLDERNRTANGMVRHKIATRIKVIIDFFSIQLFEI